MLFLNDSEAVRIPKLPTMPDWFVLNLEDGVESVDKATKRLAIQRALMSGMFRHQPVCVRVNSNSVDPSELLEDLKYVIHEDVQALLLSKTSSVAELQRCGELVSAGEIEKKIPPGWLKFFVNIESPRGVLNANKILAASDRNAAVAFGHADYLALSKGTNSPAGLHHAMSHIAMAGQAANLPIIASPWLRLKDMDTLKQEALIERQTGFTGKFVIHPKQISAVHSIFSPTKKEIATANRILSSNSRELQKRTGLFVGPPHQLQARNTLELADQIETRESTTSSTTSTSLSGGGEQIEASSVFTPRYDRLRPFLSFCLSRFLVFLVVVMEFLLLKSRLD